MHSNGANLLDQFLLPEAAQQAISKMNLQQQEVEPGVTRFSGHDRGVPFRFFVHQEYNAAKSKAARYEVYDPIEMIEWSPDACNSAVTERVRFLPEELLDLSFPEDPRGRFAEAYMRFKAGLTAAGTSLSKWGLLSDSLVASLQAERIYTVEQFASLPQGRLSGRFPPEVLEAYERAKLFVAGRDAREKSDEQTSRIVELEQQNDRLLRELEIFRAQLAEFMSGNEQPTKKRGRPAKKAEEPSVDGN